MLEKLDKHDFDKVYNIMQESFCADELRPYSEQNELLNKTNYTIFVEQDRCTKSIRAFAAVWEFKDFCFIEHLAVDKKYRGEGTGTAIIKAIAEMYQCQICLEVELPLTDTAKKRIDFYEKNGFYLNDYYYIQPPISKNRKELPLLIMTTLGKITETTFEYYKSVLYKDVYQIRD